MRCHWEAERPLFRRGSALGFSRGRNWAYRYFQFFDTLAPLLQVCSGGIFIFCLPPPKKFAFNQIL